MRTASLLWIYRLRLIRWLIIEIIPYVLINLTLYKVELDSALALEHFPWLLLFFERFWNWLRINIIILLASSIIVLFYMILLISHWVLHCFLLLLWWRATKTALGCCEGLVIGVWLLKIAIFGWRWIISFLMYLIRILRHHEVLMIWNKVSPWVWNKVRFVIRLWVGFINRYHILCDLKIFVVILLR